MAIIRLRPDSQIIEPLGIIVDYLLILVYLGILHHSTQNFVSYLNITLDYLLATCNTA